MKKIMAYISTSHIKDRRKACYSVIKALRGSAYSMSDRPKERPMLFLWSLSFIWINNPHDYGQVNLAPAYFFLPPDSTRLPLIELKTCLRMVLPICELGSIPAILMAVLISLITLAFP